MFFTGKRSNGIQCNKVMFLVPSVLTFHQTTVYLPPTLLLMSLSLKILFWSFRCIFLIGEYLIQCLTFSVKSLLVNLEVGASTGKAYKYESPLEL